RAETSLPVFVLALGIVVVVATMLWSLLRGFCRTPERMRRRRHEGRHTRGPRLPGLRRPPEPMRRRRPEPRHARGRHAIPQGLLAVGHGDVSMARRHADEARRIAGHDPLGLLLWAQLA